MVLQENGTKLFIKEITLEELNDDVMKWFENEELMKFYTNSKRKITKSSLIESIEEGKKNGNVFTFGIYDILNNVLIGTLKLGPINFVHKTSDLVALIGNMNYHGKGLASEAIALGNKLAFESYDIKKLYGGMYESNVASIKAYLRAGWLVEGRLKGQYTVNGKNEDRIEVAMFNPKYFSKQEIDEIKNRQSLFYNI